MVHPVFIQTFYYGIVMLLGAAIIGFFMKGFFWKFVKVKMSFGKYIMVKIKCIDKDIYSVGHVEEGFLCFKAHSKDKRISIEDSSPFYRSLGVNWIDVDDQKNAICKPDYSTVSGFNAAKYNDLYVRALYSPQIADKTERLMLALLVGIAIGIVVIGIIVYIQSGKIQAMEMAIQGVKSVTQQAIQKVPI